MKLNTIVQLSKQTSIKPNPTPHTFLHVYPFSQTEVLDKSTTNFPKDESLCYDL